MKKLAFLFVVLTLSATAQVTIDNLLNVPFPASLTSSPDGRRIAWVFNDQGRRNIYIAEAPDFVPKKITGYTEDDGQEITSLQFLPDNNRLIFIRGGAPNSANELPNPIAIQPGVERAIWIINSDGSGLKNWLPAFIRKFRPTEKLLPTSVADRFGW